MQPISDVTIAQIKSEIDNALEKQTGTPPIAAVDADGTLWACDLGEALFNYQINNQLLPNLPENPWQHYLSLQEESVFKAYLWLAQINAGHPLTKIKQWASEAISQLQPVPIFKGHQEIINYLHQKGVEVYIVTASVEWSVQPAASLYGVKEENVVGVSTKVIDGLITQTQEGPITYYEGKVDGLLQRTAGQKPFYAAGNTEGDLPLLNAATDIHFVLASAQPGDTNYKTERKMLSLAQQKGWFFHDFWA